MAAHIIEHHRDLVLRQLLDQAEKFLTLHAHELSFRPERPACAWSSMIGALLHFQPLDGLAGDLGYEIKVLIEMQNREPSEFRGRRDDQVRHSCQ
jgi:hypothetical protein